MKGTTDYTPVKSALDAWFQEASGATWKTPADVKRQYRNASIVGRDRIVFNIKGNSFRLVVAVSYVRKLVFIKWLGSHAEYGHIDVSKVNYAGKTNQK